MPCDKLWRATSVLCSVQSRRVSSCTTRCCRGLLAASLRRCDGPRRPVRQRLPGTVLASVCGSRRGTGELRCRRCIQGWAAGCRCRAWALDGRGGLRRAVRGRPFGPKIAMRNGFRHGLLLGSCPRQPLGPRALDDAFGTRSYVVTVTWERKRAPVCRSPRTAPTTAGRRCWFERATSQGVQGCSCL